MEPDLLVMSTMAKTWIFDIDGTLLKHNSHLTTDGDIVLEGVKSFFDKHIKEDDYIILITARPKKYKPSTVRFLNENNIRFDKIIFGVPSGERIILNDTKPKGLKTAIAIPLKRDAGLKNIIINFDKNI